MSSSPPTFSFFKIYENALGAGFPHGSKKRAAVEESVFVLNPPAKAPVAVISMTATDEPT
jgi:hypothetical protein